MPEAVIRFTCSLEGRQEEAAQRAKRGAGATVRVDIATNRYRAGEVANPPERPRAQVGAGT